MGSSRVGVGWGAGVLVLRSLWGAMGFEHFPAWDLLVRGGVSVLVLWLECVVLVLGVCSFPGWRLFCGASLPWVSFLSLAVGLVLLSAGSLSGRVGNFLGQSRRVDCSSCVLLPLGELEKCVLSVFPCPGLPGVHVFSLLSES